jgi:SAM-dependent methyltransferase
MRTDGKPEELRARLHAMWAGVAGGWARHASFVDQRGVAVTARMLELAAPRPGERVLELACGPGTVGLAAAELVTPDGHVVLSDVAAPMTEIAARRAEERGIANVSTRVLELERIAEPDASYDVVLCREGIMLVLDPARAAREIARVLKPGGRVALAVWGPRAENPWLSIVFDAVSAQLGAPMPPPGQPHPFSLDDPDRVQRLLADAGLAGVTIEAVPTPYHADSVAEWWERTVALAGPLAQKLAALPPQAAEALRARAAEAIAPYLRPDGLELPGVSLVAGARSA